MTRSHGASRSPGAAAAALRFSTALGGVTLALAACGVDSPELGETASALAVGDFTTSTCTTAVVIGLSSQIADEVGCLNPASLTRFAAGSGITITSNAVLPYLAANARTDLMAVGNVQVNSAFRTVAQQYLLLQWFNLGRCGITAAAAVGRSNHESGRAVDLQNWSARVSAMAAHGWAHDVAGDPVHFDHLASADIRGKDTLAFQRLWNRNHPTDKIAEDGAYGPQTEARLRQSPATGFAIGASCMPAAHAAALVAVDGPDQIAPGARAHYRLTLDNATDAEWPATATLAVAGGGASELYDAVTWASAREVGPIGEAIPAGAQGTLELDVVAPQVAAPTPISTELAVMDGANQVGSASLSVTVTPGGDPEVSADAGDPVDGEVSGGCSAGGGAGWLALAPLLVALRRRRR